MKVHHERIADGLWSASVDVRGTVYTVLGPTLRDAVHDLVFEVSDAGAGTYDLLCMNGTDYVLIEGPP